MRLQFERLPAPLWLRTMIPIASVLVTFLLTSGFVIAVGANPLQAAYYFLLDPLSNPVRLIEVLVKSTPLLMTGAAVAFAFAGAYWNIGVEGQLYMGATAATAIGLHMDGVPAWIALPLIVIGGFLAGMGWAVLPAFMKVRLKIDEVVTTLLPNYVAIFVVSALLNGPWRNPISQWPQSPEIAASAMFPRLIPRSRLHLGFILAILIIIALWFVLNRKARKRWVDVSTPAGPVPALIPPGVPDAAHARMDAVPSLGQHTKALLAELGYGEADIARLEKEKAI